MKRDWWKEAVVYQIYPRSFKDSNKDGIGDIGGIIEKLEYLQDLGIDVIWLSPVYRSPNVDNGYDISDYQAIMEDFGTMEDFDRMLEKAHSLGIKVMMDLALNHTSDKHPWFAESEKSGDPANPYGDYYIWRDPKPDGKQNGGLYGDGGPFYVNGPRVHEYLQEMNEQVLSGCSLMTVGETPGASVEDAVQYAGENTHELNMVFQFEHVDGDRERPGKYGKWDGKDMPLPQWKKVLSKWQTGLEGKGWNSLYLSNHDQPRSVSRFGDDSPEYRVLSAKMLATCLHMMKGTPYIYQGEELGMTNAYFETLEDYRDVESLNAYKELTKDCGETPETVLGYLKRIGRDNARTPMQWDDSANAGFTAGIPWIRVNPNFTEINARQQQNDTESVFQYYKKLIHLRHTMDVVVYGRYELLEPEDENLFAYTRTLEDRRLLVICNFTKQELPIPRRISRFIGPEADVVISNYAIRQDDIIRPYEAVAYLIKGMREQG